MKQLTDAIINSGELKPGDFITPTMNFYIPGRLQNPKNLLFRKGKPYEILNLKTTPTGSPGIIVECEKGPRGIWVSKKGEDVLGGAEYFTTDKNIDLTDTRPKQEIQEENDISKKIKIGNEWVDLLRLVSNAFITQKLFTIGVPKKTLINYIGNQLPYVRPEERKEVYTSLDDEIESLRGYGYLEYVGEKYENLKPTYKGEQFFTGSFSKESSKVY